MSLDKEQLQALLADYVEGSLSEQQIDEAEAYLSANPGVRTVVDRLMIDSEALRALPRQRASVDFSEDFRGQAERDLLLGDVAGAKDPTRALGGPMLALAAMLIVGLGIGGAGYYLLAYRPATNLEFAKVAAEQVAATEPTAVPIDPAASESRSRVISPAPAAASRDESDGKAWDRAFAPATGGGAGPAVTMSAPMPLALKAQAASQAVLPADVALALGDRSSTARAAFVIVVDPSSLETTRQLVRAAFAESAGDAAATAMNNAAPAGVANGESPTTLPDGAVAIGVPTAAVERMRALFGDGSGATVYDVAPPQSKADVQADARAADTVRRGEAQQGAKAEQLRQASQQQASGVFRERTEATPTSGETVDVYVIARSPTTRP